ncbi:MAG: hypothetical protein KAJ55_09705 [Anaerolineales bacterium]|nr:hypothetical protein [Anaerolineales bacterium]
MSQAPERIFIDPRVAFRLPASKGDAAEVQAGGSDAPVGYIREDIFNEKLRQAAQVDQEILVMIQAVGSTLFGLSNLGRLYAHGSAEGVDGWHLVAERELSP